MTEFVLQPKELTDESAPGTSSSVVEWQIHAVPNPADDATLDGCGCGCGCGCSCA